MFSTDDYWEGNDYDCLDDLPDYLRDEYNESFSTERKHFSTDDYYGDDTDDYYYGAYY